MAFLNTVAGAFVPPSTLTVLGREQVWDVVTIIDPAATPILDKLQVVDVESSVVQWPIDNLPSLVTSDTAGAIAVDGINTQGILEGFDSPSFSSNYPHNGPSGAPAGQRLTNFVQLFAGRVGVSDRLKRSGGNVGIKNPYNNEMVKVGRVMKKAAESRLFDNPSYNSNCTVGTAADPSRFRYLFEWTDSTKSGSNPINQVTVGGLITPDYLDSATELGYSNGAEPTIAAMSMGSKSDLNIALRQATGTNLGVINTSNVQAAEMKIIRNVDIYHGNQNPLSVMVSRQIPSSANTTGGGKVWLLEMDKLAWGRFTPLTHIPLAKTGYNTKGIMVMEGTVFVYNPKALCVLNNVTT